MAYLSLIAAIVGTALGHFCLRYYGVSGKRLWLILGVLLFLQVPLYSLLALRTLSIGTVYLSTGMIPVLTTLIAWSWLKERITRHHIIGLVMITGGTALYFWQ